MVSQAVSDFSSNLGLLGAQVLLAIAAYRRPEDRHHCRVRDESFLGSELVTGNSRKFLVYDSLPGTVHNKAVGLDKATLFIELTPFDPERLKELPSTLPKGVQFKDGHLWLGKRKLAHCIRSSEKIEEEHSARALWTIRWSALSEESLQIVVATLDQLDQEGAYLDEASDVGTSLSGMSLGAGSSAGGQTLELRLGLQMDLIQTQVPVLAIGIGMRTEMQMDIEFAQMLRFEQMLARNAAQAIEQALEKDDSPAGQARVANFILFAMARQVKNAAAEIGHEVSWSKARKVARDLMQRQR